MTLRVNAVATTQITVRRENMLFGLVVKKR